MNETDPLRAQDGKTSTVPHPPVLGWLCTYTPEELVLAHGLVPARIGGCQEHPPQTPLLPSNLCPYVRSVLDEAGKGTARGLAAVSLVASCDAMRRLADAWKRSFPGIPVHVIDSPRRRDRAAHAYLASQYRSFLDFLSRVSGREAGEAEIRNAVALVNNKRRLLARLSELRKEDPPGISGSEFFRAVSASFRIHPATFLREYGHQAPRRAGRGPRLIVTGSIVESEGFFGAVEEAGANVVAEDICTGLRGIAGEVAEDGSLLENLASRYLGRSPCSRMSGAELRISSLLALVREYRAQGVIFHCLKFCDQYQYDYPLVRRRLEESGIPVLRIETDYQERSRGQLATRIEAFVEVLT